MTTPNKKSPPENPEGFIIIVLWLKRWELLRQSYFTMVNLISNYHTVDVDAAW